MNKLEDLKNRFFISAGIILASVLLIIFSDLVVMRGIVALALCFFAVVAVYEYIHIIKSKKIEISTPLFLGAVVCEILAFFIYSQFPNLYMLPVFIIILFFILLFIINFKEIERSIVRISVASFGFMYLSIPFGMLLAILYMQSFQVQDGRYWVLYLVFVTKLTDIGAYFGGRLFGKKKLAPIISPKKTVFGAVSGSIFAIIGSLIFLVFSKENTFDLKVIEAIIMGIILGIGAQFGDLCESLLKRDAKIKNSSKIPGLGGVLDMFDSLMFNIPIMYIYLLG
jgi:phosphatidate cytidylyltransferase